jgi:two-component system response regulator MprA
MRVLVVDDERAVRDAVRRALALDGYEVEVAADGRQALDLLSLSSPEAVVLDVLMPEIDGLEVCRRLREAGDETPIMLLTVRDEVTDVVAGLDAGADDYLTKPFDTRELLARLRALIRRTSTTAGDQQVFADLRMDVATREVTRAGRHLELSRTEFALLELLLRHARRVLTREQIFEHVWGYDPGPRSNALEVYVGYLRRKLEAGGEPRLLHTVRGVGYVMREA